MFAINKFDGFFAVGGFKNGVFALRLQDAPDQPPGVWGIVYDGDARETVWGHAAEGGQQAIGLGGLLLLREHHVARPAAAEHKWFGWQGMAGAVNYHNIG